MQVEVKDEVQIMTSFYSFYGRDRAWRLRLTMESKGGRVRVIGQINAKVIKRTYQPLASKVKQNWGQALIQGHFISSFTIWISAAFMDLVEILSNMPWVRDLRGSSLQVEVRDEVQMMTSFYSFFYRFFMAGLELRG